MQSQIQDSSDHSSSHFRESVATEKNPVYDSAEGAGTQYVEGAQQNDSIQRDGNDDNSGHGAERSSDVRGVGAENIYEGRSEGRGEDSGISEGRNNESTEEVIPNPQNNESVSEEGFGRVSEPLTEAARQKPAQILAIKCAFDMKNDLEGEQ